MAVQIKTAVFEGPFDILLHLIEKNEIDIYDIPIARITEEYLGVLAEMEVMDLDVASEFLVMATTLLSIKARMLLPKPVVLSDDRETVLEEDDPRDELVEKLLEYRRFKELAEIFREREAKQSQVFFREVDPGDYSYLFEPENPLEGVEVGDLIHAFFQILKRSEKEEPQHEVEKEEVTIGDRMTEILRILNHRSEGATFRSLFHAASSKVEMVITFLALLELIKLSRIRIHQQGLFQDIHIYSEMSAGEVE